MGLVADARVRAPDEREPMTDRTSRRGWRRVFTSLTVAAAGLLALSACAGGVAGGGGSGGGADGDTIKLGMLAPFSGSESAFGPYMKNAAQLAIDEINEAGGVNGQMLELVTEDDACDATTATAAANKLVTAGVTFSIGGYCSGATLPTLPIFTDAGIPMVIPAANSNKLVEAGIDGVFLINGTGTQQAQAALAYAAKSGHTKIAVVDDTTDYSVDLAESVKSQAGDAGVEVVLHEKVNPGESDYSTAVNKIVGSGAELVYWTGYYQEGGLIAAQLKQAGYTGAYMVADGSVDAKLAEIAGDAGEGVLGTFTQTPDMLQGADAWISAYKDKFGAEPGPYSTQAYDAVRVAAEALRTAQTQDYEGYVAALNAIDGLQLFSGPLKFTPEGTLSSGGFVIVTVGPDGTFVLKDDLLS